MLVKLPKKFVRLKDVRDQWQEFFFSNDIGNIDTSEYKVKDTNF